MAAYDDALRGYAFHVLKRDGFRCRYCGLDGTVSFAGWLSLSWDHLLPKGHELWDNPDYIVAACMFCNTADQEYFEHAEKLGLGFEGKTPGELVELRRPYIDAIRTNYELFWLEHVAKPEVLMGDNG